MIIPLLAFICCTCECNLPLFFAFSAFSRFRKKQTGVTRFWWFSQLSRMTSAVRLRRPYSCSWHPTLISCIDQAAAEVSESCFPYRMSGRPASGQIDRTIRSTVASIRPHKSANWQLFFLVFYVTSAHVQCIKNWRSNLLFLMSQRKVTVSSSTWFPQTWQMRATMKNYTSSLSSIRRTGFRSFSCCLINAWYTLGCPLYPKYKKIGLQNLVILVVSPASAASIAPKSSVTWIWSR